MAGTRVTLHRNEKSGVLAADADNMIFKLKYDMSTGTRMLPGNNNEELSSGYPIAIYAYEIRMLGDFYGQVYQTYGDTDDESSLTNWSLSNDEFNQGLKQWRQICGTSTTLDKTVIKYRAKKNPKHLRAKFGKWKRPPIYLGPDAGNAFYVGVHNSSDSTERTYLCHVAITSWKQFT